MWHPCAECTTSIRFVEAGALHIQAPTPEIYSYQSFEQLEQLLTSLLRVADYPVSCRATQSRYVTAPILASELLEQLKHRFAIDFIQHGVMTSHLQPIYDIQRNVLVANEALLRAADDNTPISPGVLFSTASKMGLHSRLDQRAREEAIRATHHIGGTTKTFINFLPSTIYNPEYCLRHTFEIVERYQVDPSRLVFEVVETEKIEDVNHLKHVFEQYKKQGIQVALDDVGAGFSTLDMLSLLQPDYIKIDRSFIDHCDTNSENEAFLRKARHLTREMGIQILAEGIERQEELDLCRELGFDLGQGYLLGRPAPYARFAKAQ
ncbi:diguanylate phosphodiesterase [Exiguobacterium indicum]|uniref:EAL domain-containing protein n=1 Tax=Exiguobacterium indicum TaxID=296995 RepID=UPI000735FB80|nr:EAL domain-containing protein [Exiguobacterium indicum]KTR58782.1 diguanylate phosphodiesterase [Exiguobacterium indicum]